MKERLTFKNIRFLATTSILAAMALSALLSFLLSSLITMFNIRNTVTGAQARIAQSVRTLTESDALSVEEILSVLDSDAYPLAWREEIGEYRLTEVQTAALCEGGAVYVQQNLLPLGETLVPAEGGYWVISVNPDSNQFMDTTLYLVMTLLMALGMSAILITELSKYLMRPFRNLEKAMQQVEKGDFSARLPVRGDGEMAKVNASFNAMAKELSKVEMLRQDFVSSVSHEFKTPITSIHGFARLLQASGLNEEQAEYADVIAAESSRLSKLVTNVLRLTRLENDERIAQERRFRLDEQLRQCMVALEGEWAKKEIDWDVGLERVDVVAEEELLTQVWLNLMGNAVKFSAVGGTVSVRLRREGGDAVVEVEDEGVGMSAQTQAHIFEKFYQGEEARSHEGNGLGLSIAGRIVHRCAGRIEVWSEEGVGSRFTVRLPVNRGGDAERKLEK